MPPTTPSGTRSSISLELELEAWKAGVIGALNIATRILAVRVILLVAMIGGIALTGICLLNPDPYRLIALSIYCGTALVPMILMSLRTRQ